MESNCSTGGGGHSHDTLVHISNGSDTVSFYGRQATIGGGSDTISLSGNSASEFTLHQIGYTGHDTINTGCGSDTIFEQGQATVHGVVGMGSASISGGQLDIVEGQGGFKLEALSGSATLLGGSHTYDFVGGTGSVIMDGSASSHNERFFGGSGHDTMTGGSGNNVFEILSGGHHVITNFVSGQDQLIVEGHSMAYLTQNHDITSSGGNTFITLDGGATTIELKGVGSLHSTDVITNGKC